MITTIGISLDGLSTNINIKATIMARAGIKSIAKNVRRCWVNILSKTAAAIILIYSY